MGVESQNNFQVHFQVILKGWVREMIWLEWNASSTIEPLSAIGLALGIAIGLPLGLTIGLKKISSREGGTSHTTWRLIWDIVSNNRPHFVRNFSTSINNASVIVHNFAHSF
jgi:hypothetical protein